MKAYGEIEQDIKDIKKVLVLLYKYGLSDTFQMEVKDIIDKWENEL